MSNELNELISISKELGPRLNRFYSKYQKMEEDTVRARLTAEERYQFMLLYQVADKLEDADLLIHKMNKEIIYEGRLMKNGYGRYEVEGYELTSGAPLEVWYEDEEEPGYYVPSRLEHSGGDYYIVALGREKNIEGVLVRIK
ncbi:DUF5348 domain-containing protein [Bacillus firmus]|uniref:DUF5348 domain-containing protein n=1 Tax=Cytobacillus TaxID=2675230 RepID=UPI0011A5EC97|nr:MULTISPECIES: DUF5348 domain-containing protein [Cytobacillus]MBZ9534532.1 DUF5348 domain-containing protein [Cytobacillus oceanisediminis]NUH82913.1 DUF5348 domain-containing protein [Cytobacillus firmus]